ncbi:MAG: hypothetical protein IJ794_08345 [Lachnospiraceae bacterium]|nr:hypothetical protein [Lachnospiraceae bacterium]
MANSFSKESLLAVIDGCTNINKEQFAFYFEHYNDSQGILDAINFGRITGEGGYIEGKFPIGVLGFLDEKGNRCAVPNYAIAKMNPSRYPEMKAANGQLVLKNKSYCSFRAMDGKSYVMSVCNGRLQWAHSEAWLDTPDRGVRKVQAGNNPSWDMRKTGNILSALAQGKSPFVDNKADTIEALKRIGVTAGKFTIDAGAGRHNWMIMPNGVTLNLDQRVDFYNVTNWIDRGYKEGDVFNIYGCEYTVGSDGHIRVSAEDPFTTTEVKYPERSH